ncbi:MAG: hypothetical protein ABR961_00750 [Thermoanaerobaculaceae bacterium]|jgi:hypothetical protein
MRTGWQWLAAEVEWHDGHRAFERPVRLRLGDRVLELTIDKAWVEGPASGGSELIRVFLVRDAGTRRFRISACDGGHVAVEVEESK